MSNYYNTDNGVVDISGYDEDQQIKFFMINPNATEATSLDTREAGLTRPNSEIVEEENEAILKAEEIEKEKFIYLKFGTMNQRSGTYYGGKGDDVSREDFTGKKKEIPLNTQIEERVRANDLDMTVQNSDYYYNKNKDVDFVRQHYSSEDLADSGVDLANFQGYLESSGYKDEFDEMLDDNSFDGNWFSDQKELDLQKQRILKGYLEGYLNDQNNRLTEKVFVEDYYKNPEKYKDYKDCYKDGGTTVFDYDKLNLYNDAYYGDINIRDAQNRKKFRKYIDDVEQQSDVAGGALGTLEFFGDIIGGAWGGLGDLATTMADWVYLDGVANRRRLTRKEQDLEDVKEMGQYMLFRGKMGKVDGVEYGIDDDGSIYNITENRNVTSALSAQEYEKRI